MFDRGLIQLVNTEFQMDAEDEGFNNYGTKGLQRQFAAPSSKSK